VASATYESVRAVRAGRAAIGVGSRGRNRGPAAPSRSGVSPLLRGAAASVLIASGYVALMAGARWLLGAILG